MFRAGAPNPYDEIVIKTTDENLTAENWELILNLCDKVNDEGEPGARNVISALLKRLAHRNPNVQLYALALAEALSKNCRIELHRELASRSFTQGLERLITDRTTHERVKRKALGLIAMWTEEFEKDSTLGIMEECYSSLKAKNYSFEQPDEPPPPQVDDEIRRREEEELQRVLEMSLHDKGGRSDYSAYGAGSSTTALNSISSVPVPLSSLKRSNTSHSSPNTGYTEAEAQSVSPSAQSFGGTQSPVSSTSHTAAQQTGTITRVRALHTFQPTDKGELAFEKGDIIKVVDRNYKDWWRGQLKGRTGIFPVNYVEPLPEPTPSEIAKEAEQEALIFSQAANIDKLLSMLRGMDPAKDNLADNEDIQELYRQSMSLRPKIVKLIDKYSQKRAELVSMNESFVKARNIFDHMMEESLARHSGVYDQRPSYAHQQSRPNITPHTDYRASSYGAYDQPAYNAFSQANVAYPPSAESGYAGAMYPPTAKNGYTGATPQPFVNQQVPYQPNQSPYVPSPQQPIAQVNGVSPAMAVQSQSQVQDHAPISNEQQQQQQGPPYIFDPQRTYADPNVQAWAQYYSQGGKDRTGAVYFVSVPGVTDEQGPPAPIQQQSTTSQHSNIAPYQSYSNGTQAAANSSNSSLHTQADSMSTAPIQTQAHVVQQMMPQPVSPTLQHRQSYPQQGVLEGPAHTQVVPTGSQAYPPNPYQTEQPAEYFQPGTQPPSNPAQDPVQIPNQFVQMQSQFGGMGLGEQLSPSGHGVPAAQTA